MLMRSRNVITLITVSRVRTIFLFFKVELI
jgi:hypothetical protein